MSIARLDHHGGSTGEETDQDIAPPSTSNLPNFLSLDSSSQIRGMHDLRDGPEDRLHVPLLKQDRRATLVLPEDRAKLGGSRQRFVIKQCT